MARKLRQNARLAINAGGLRGRTTGTARAVRSVRITGQRSGARNNEQATNYAAKRLKPFGRASLSRPQQLLMQTARGRGAAGRGFLRNAQIAAYRVRAVGLGRGTGQRGAGGRQG